MKTKAVSRIILMLLLVGMSTLVLDIQLVEASGTIYIRADGSIDPPTAPISTFDNFTYTVADNIHYEEIVVERSNIIIDGNGYWLRGSGPGEGETGIRLDSVNSVVIINTSISDFSYGIKLYQSSNNILYGNNIWGNDVSVHLRESPNNTVYGNYIDSDFSLPLRGYGIWLEGSPNNTISGNSLAGNGEAVVLEYITSSNNEISGNNIINNFGGVYFKVGSTSNVLYGNNITSNSIGVSLSSWSNTVSGNIISDNGMYGLALNSVYNKVTGNNIIGNDYYGIAIKGSNNEIYHNNIGNNGFGFDVYPGYANSWDDGYPSGGNCWWYDYTGVDLYSGPYQNETGSDDIGDTPYVINEDNVDEYPLMNFWEVAIPRPPPPPQLPSRESPIASFIYDPYVPLVGEEITFDASSSYDPDGEIVSYQWDFGDSSTVAGMIVTHSYASEESYTVTLTVTDNDGKTDIATKTVNVKAKRPVVVLVHGFESWTFDPYDDWSDMEESLTMAGFDVFISDYTQYYPTLSDDYWIPGGYPLYHTGTPRHIWSYAIGLQTEILQLVKNGGADEVYIVAHSMGGLVARWCVEILGMDYFVDKLVMLETPNRGVTLSKELLSLILGKGVLAPAVYLWDSTGDLTRQSKFLEKLNRYYWNGHEYVYDPSAYSPWDFWYPYNDMKSPNVHYELLGSPAYSKFEWIFDFDHVRAYEPENVFPHLGFLDGHSQLREDSTVIQRVIEILKDDPELAQQTSQEIPVQFAPSTSDKISPDEQKSYEILVTSSSEVDFMLMWSEGDLNLTLVTPNGKLINQSVAEMDPDITYYQYANITREGYNIKNPDSGTWILNVTACMRAANTTEQQDYIVMTFFDTNINLFCDLYKYHYDPNEPMHIKSKLFYSNDTVTEASVTAAILKPDNSTETIMLYDDGLHNDNQTNDGIYANAFTNTSLWGAYDMTVTANGTVESEQFARQTFAKVWVAQYPDLALNESDIHFSKETPLEGEKITINATISNVGEADANNASILFYDGTPANGTLIGECTINATAGGAENASIQWNATRGTHQINVLISPYNEFLELNYTNNIAHRAIEVTIAGDVDRDCKIDASDLFKLSKAYGSALEDPNWDESCDFNGDDQVDDSDLSELNKNYGKTV